ncbi:MAG TPA: flagellar hook protein FlgE, partial [Aquificaceae bacterium]|nr:flagellar hook protein FlgE [Aquificaceae bacterium]
MLRSFFNAITGMDVSRFALDVTSDNLANANTVGFKKSRPIFQDMVSQVIVGLNTTTGTIKTTTFGAGAVVDSTQKVWSIGNFKQTEFTTDLAIEGKALFILKDPINNQQLYTRDGRFRINREGYMINPNGLYLQGFKVDPITGEVTGTQLENIRIETQIQPKATGILSFLQPTNLNAEVPVIDPETLKFDPTNPNSYHYRYTVTMYDSLGNPYEVDLFFKKVNNNTWRVFILSDYTGDATLEDLIANAYAYGEENDYNYLTLQFDSNTGKLLKLSKDDKMQAITIGNKRIYYLNIFDSKNKPKAGLDTREGGVIGNKLDQFNLSDPNQMILILGEEPLGDSTQEVNDVDDDDIQEDRINFSYITQHASEFVVTMDQDGYARGELIDVYILS